MFGPDFGKEPHEIKIEIFFNALTREFTLRGCDKNAVVALGVLEYALARIRRFLVQSDIEREIQNAPQISIPRGPLV